MLHPSQHPALLPFCPPNNLMHSLLTTTSLHDVSHKPFSYCTNSFITFHLTQFNIIHCKRPVANNVTFVIITVSFAIINIRILLLVVILLSLILRVKDVQPTHTWILSLHSITAAEIKKRNYFKILVNKIGLPFWNYKKHSRVYVTHILDYLQFNTITLNDQ
jgi:hypothetical protein